MEMKELLMKSKILIEGMGDKELLITMKMCMDEYFKRTGIGDDIVDEIHIDWVRYRRRFKKIRRAI